MIMKTTTTFLARCAFAAMALTATAASAGEFETVGAPTRHIRERSVDVAVHAKAQATVTNVDGTGSRTVDLTLTGAGVRTKRVIVNVPVYAATSYTDLAQGLDANRPLPDVERATVKALKLTFFRDLSRQEIADAFRESLALNGVDANRPEIKKIFAEMPAQVAARSEALFLGYAAGDVERLEVNFPGHAIVSEGPKLAFDFWKMWFGQPSDAGLADLKRQLLSHR